MIPYANRNWASLLVSASGSLAPGVALRVLVFGLIALAAYLADHVHWHVRLPVGLYEISGAVIALVLAFRSNTAYARFWEGRTLWGSIVNASRNIARITGRYATQDPADQREIAVWTVAFAHATRRALRGQDTFPELEGVLPDDALEALRAAPHPALFAADQISRRVAALLAAGKLDPLMAASAEEEIRILVNDLGGCERIHKTPTPIGYVLLIQRFVAVYLASLPFALVAELGRLTPLLTVVVAYPVLLIEALGSELDDPFGHHPNDLPLTRICSTIQYDLLGFRPPAELAHARHDIED
jgi:putative membrane protein